MAIRIETVAKINCLLGESPMWDVRRKCLHFVDILSSVIYSYYPATGDLQSTTTPPMASAIAPCKDGRSIVATADGIYMLDIDNDTWSYFLSPERGVEDNRYNDGKCDASGRFWIGSMHQEERDGKGKLYVVEKNQSYKKVLDDITISNGLEWNPDGSLFYHIDSPTGTVKRYSYDAVSAHISAAETIINFSAGEGVPDGMTMDETGMLWIAHFGGSCITRHNPETGEVLMKIELPVSQVTSCCFGGNGLNDLYITTAAKDLSDIEFRRMPQSGYTFVVKDIGVKGLAANEFGKSAL